MSSGTHSGQLQEHGEGGHAGPRTYVLIAVILAVLTAAEVAVFYIEVLQPALVPILLTLTSGKFSLVVLFFMHLKFDSRVFATVFVPPLLLAMAMIIALIILLKVLPLGGV